MKQKTKGSLWGVVAGVALCAVAGLGAVKILGVKVELPEKPSEKETRKDLAVIDFTNNAKGTTATATNLNQLLGLDTEEKIEKSIFTGPIEDDEIQYLYLDGGGLRFGNSSVDGQLDLLFKKHYDYISFTGVAYNTPVYVDADKGITSPVYDEDGEKIIQKWNCDDSYISFMTMPDGSFDCFNETKYHFYTNGGELRAPNPTRFEFDLSAEEYKNETGIRITNNNGRFILTSIELWNSNKEEMPSEEKPAEDSTTSVDSTTSAE